MTTSTRLTLLLAAAMCAGFVALIGSMFSRGVEPDEYDITTFVFWLLVGAAVALPLWAPASVPNSFPIIQKLSSWACAAAMLVPICIFGSIVVHNVRRAVSGFGVEPSALVMGLVLTGTCIWCAFILVRPDLRAREK